MDALRLCDTLQVIFIQFEQRIFVFYFVFPDYDVKSFGQNSQKECVSFFLTKCRSFEQFSMQCNEKPTEKIEFETNLTDVRN